MNIEFPSEKIIDDYVYSKIMAEQFCPVAGEHVQHCVRQHEIRGYGITDLIKILRYGNQLEVTILELKNEPLKEAHISQLARYMVGLRRQLRRYANSGHVPFDIEVRGELAGPLDVGRNDFVYMLDIIEDITVYDISLTMEDGFCSNMVNAGWHNNSEDLLGAKPIIRQLHSRGMFKPMLRVVEGGSAAEGGL